MGVKEFVKELQDLSEDQREIIIGEGDRCKRMCVMECCLLGDILYIEGMGDDEVVEINNISSALIEKDYEKYTVVTKNTKIEIIF